MNPTTFIYKCQNFFSWILGQGKVINSLLMLVATICAAIATWNSNNASQEASATALAAYDFSLRTAQDTSNLQRPELTVLSGKISEEDTEADGYTKKTRYLVELSVRNSGARDASPSWIAIGSNLLQVRSLVKKVANIPKDQTVTINFDVIVSADSDFLRELKSFAVGFRFVDTAPFYKFKTPQRSENWFHEPTGFNKVCSMSKIQVLTIHRIKLESGKNQIFLSMGPSLLIEEVNNKNNWDDQLEAARGALSSISSKSSENSECPPSSNGA